MKLLFCPACHDAFGLRPEQWRRCRCGASGGQYNRDNETATIGGKARVFGVGNPFFFPFWSAKTEEEKERYRCSYYGRNQDCWWGESPETPGDVQLFRIEAPAGPRLRIKIYFGTSEKLVKVIDSRNFTVDGRSDTKEFVMPGHRRPLPKPLPWHKRWLARFIEEYVFGR